MDVLLDPAALEDQTDEPVRREPFQAVDIVEFEPIEMSLFGFDEEVEPVDLDVEISQDEFTDDDMRLFFLFRHHLPERGPIVLGADRICEVDPKD